MMCVVVGDAGGNLDHDDCGNSVDGGDACCCWCYQRQHSRNILSLLSVMMMVVVHKHTQGFKLRDQGLYSFTLVSAPLFELIILYAAGVCMSVLSRKIYLQGLYTTDDEHIPGNFNTLLCSLGKYSSRNTIVSENSCSNDLLLEVPQ